MTPRIEGLEARSLLAAYSVSPLGNDANPGTPAAPWATLQHAVDSVEPGDSIVVQSGTYAGCRIGTTGTAQAPIVLKAAPGATVVVNRPGPVNRHGGTIEVENYSQDVNYWTIRGLEVTGATQAGIDLRNADYITVVNCYSHHNGKWGIFTAFTDHLSLVGNHCSYSSGEHGIYVSNSSNYGRIVGNEVDHNRASGIQVNADASQGDTGTSVGFVITGNYAHDNGAIGGAALNFDGLQKSLISGNRLINNLAGGIVLYKGDAGGGSSNNRVIGNTITMAPNSRYAININTDSTGNYLAGNVIRSSNGAISIDASSLQGFVSNLNVFGPNPLFSIEGVDGPKIDLAAWRKATGQDRRSTVLSK